LIYNLEELEKKCKKYRRKKLMKAFLVLGLFVAGAFYLYNSFKPSATPQLQQRADMVKKSVKRPPVEEEASLKKVNEKKENKVKPVKKSGGCFAVQVLYSYDKYLGRAQEEQKRLNQEGLDCYIKRSETQKDRIYLRCNAAYTKAALNPFLDYLKKGGIGDFFIVNEDCVYAKKGYRLPALAKAKPVKQEPKSSKKDVKVVNVLSSKKAGVEKLLQVYKRRPNYDIALKIAKEFYEKKDYQKALEWAKRANRLNRQKEGAWLLYANSLEALGKRDKAVELLRLFLNFQNSKEAQKLLTKWSRN